MAEETYIKKPCQHCPFRKDVVPFLTPERGEELAYAAQNPWNTFHCHKTLEADDSEDGNLLATESSKHCAGFLTLMAAELGEEEAPDGFEPSYEMVYSEAWEMAGAYEEANQR